MVRASHRPPPARAIPSRRPPTPSFSNLSCIECCVCRVSAPTSSHYFEVSAFSGLEKVLRAILAAACPPHPPPITLVEKRKARLLA